MTGNFLDGYFLERQLQSVFINIQFAFSIVCLYPPLFNIFFYFYTYTFNVNAVVSFTALETWEKVIISGLKPQPRSESVSLAVSSLVLSGTNVTSVEVKSSRIRIRSCNSADRGNRHSSYLPSNKVNGCQVLLQTYENSFQR